MFLPSNYTVSSDQVRGKGGLTTRLATFITVSLAQELLILMGLVVGWQFNCTPRGRVKADMGKSLNHARHKVEPAYPIIASLSIKSVIKSFAGCTKRTKPKVNGDGTYPLDRQIHKSCILPNRVHRTGSR